MKPLPARCASLRPLLRHPRFRSSLVGAALTLVVALHPAAATADEIAPFTSDGCSAFPDGTLQQQQLWLACCKEHDYTYWKGGTYQERLAADRDLQACVAATGEPAIAALMLAGVRVGGSPYFPTRFRWGYGWPYPRGYRALTAAEIASINRLGR